MDATGVARATCTAPVNIAVVKYWGKRDAELNLPVNASLSGTLCQDQLRTTTTVAASRDFDGEDRMWLNGRPADLGNPRVRTVLREMRALARLRHAHDPAMLQRVDSPLHIVSVNDFPTGAGLASSASGYACLVSALAHLYGVVGDAALSAIARRGSGSACRSMYGGFVKWEMGVKVDGSDSIAVQVAPETHWPEMQVLVCVVSEEKKETSSTAGMQATVKTSKLMKYRAEHVVPDVIGAMERAIAARDFDTFGRLTMQESNQFHAVCLDTYPPILYLNDTSRAVIHAMTRLNAFYGRVVGAYTFDAGPNAVIYALAPDMRLIIALMQHIFPTAGHAPAADAPALDGALLAAVGMAPRPNALSRLIHTHIGGGPQSSSARHLIDAQGEPLLS